jgi:hypothetical protein
VNANSIFARRSSTNDFVVVVTEIDKVRLALRMIPRFLQFHPDHSRRLGRFVCMSVSPQPWQGGQSLLRQCLPPFFASGSFKACRLVIMSWQPAASHLPCREVVGLSMM